MGNVKPGVPPSPALRSDDDQIADLLGWRMDLMVRDEFLDAIVESARAQQRLLVGTHNMNSLALLSRDDAIRRLFQRADLAIVDGAPLVALLRLKGVDARMKHRLATLDFIDDLCARFAEDGRRIVHVGSREPTMSAAASELRRRVPSLDLVMLDGFFDRTREGEENLAKLADIASLRPDLLMVGLGMPAQEAWILENLEDLPSCPILVVGGVMGYLGGDRPTTPRWLGRFGLEWAYRLVVEPRRLWRRYLLEPLPLVVPLVREVVRTRRDLRRRGSTAPRRRE
jgi:N-acetylglucosaminyldiphosphoundecaprenol N-acetyl-beta-D-mannosaminyltransferase